MATSTSTPIRRRVKEPNGSELHLLTDPDFGALGEIDAHIEKSATPDALVAAIRRRPETPPELAKRLRKARLIRSRQAQVISALAERAVFDIETLPRYFLTPKVTGFGDSQRIAVAATILPWTDGKPEEKGSFLCLDAINSRDGLRCQLRVIRLSVNGDARSVLVTGHVCERLAERAKIRGSHVAYLARSIITGDVQIRPQTNREPLLAVYDFDGKAILGYCPIGERTCGLHGGRSTLVGELRSDYVKDQARWRLKSFLLPQYCETYADDALGY